MVNHSQAVEAAIETMQGTLQLAAAFMAAGRTVDLGGLDRDAARLCAAVGVLPAREARSLRPALEALLRDLDHATAALATAPD